MKKEIELKELLGLHMLSAVSNETQQLPSYDDETYDASVLLFTLDGVTYKAMEDDNDGYRSCMKELIVTDEVIKNQFEPHQIFGIYIERSDYGYDSADIVRFYDIKTGMPVLEVGTDHADDYYPRFVSNFKPENLYANKS